MRYGVTHDGHSYWTPGRQAFLALEEAETFAFLEVLHAPRPSDFDHAPEASSYWLTPDAFAPLDRNIERNVNDTGSLPRPTEGLGALYRALSAPAEAIRSILALGAATDLPGPYSAYEPPPSDYQQIQIDSPLPIDVTGGVPSYPNEKLMPVGYQATERDHNYLDAYRLAEELANQTAVPPEEIKKRYYVVLYENGQLVIRHADCSDRDLRFEESVAVGRHRVGVAHLCPSEEEAKKRAWLQLMGPSAPPPLSYGTPGPSERGAPLSAEEHAGYVRAWRQDALGELRAELRPRVLAELKAELEKEVGLLEVARKRVECEQQAYHGALAVMRQLEENEHQSLRQARERALAMTQTDPTLAPRPTVAAAAAPVLSAITSAVKETTRDAVDTVKSDGKKALLRTTCRQGVRVARDAALSVMKKHRVPKAGIGLVERVLSTRAGEGLLGWGLGAIITRVPVLSDHPAAKVVAEELRVEGMSVGSDTIADLAREYLIPNLGPIFDMFTQASAQLDREPAELGAAPVKVAAPPGVSVRETTPAT